MNNHQDKLKKMQEGGCILIRILTELLATADVGIDVAGLEESAQKRIKEARGTPSFMTVETYKWATCICINEQVVHGIPSSRTLCLGDLLTIDIGMLLHGYHTDTARTIIVGEKRHRQDDEKVWEEKRKFLDSGKLALEKAIKEARPGNRVGHISKTIEDHIKGDSYSVIKSLVGHGIGKVLHEEPQIPGVLQSPIRTTSEIKEGQALAIEVIYAKGSGRVKVDKKDGWTMSTKDKSLTAVFEHTIFVSKDGPIVITRND